MRPSREYIEPARWSRTRIFRRAAREGFTYHLHFHPECELVLLERRGAEVYVGEDVFRCGPGDLVFVDIETPHTFVSGPGRGAARAVCVQFEARVLAGFDESGWNPAARRGAAGVVFAAAGCRDAAGRLRALAGRWERGESPRRGVEVHGELCGIMARLAGRKAVAAATRPRFGPARKGATEMLHRVLNFLHERTAEPVAPAEVAAVAGLRVESFCRFFKRHTGRTFSEYLNGLRTAAAARLLTETDKTVLEIALAVGYENLSYFNRRFKKRYGLTPREYRRKHTL